MLNMVAYNRHIRKQSVPDCIQIDRDMIMNIMKLEDEIGELDIESNELDQEVDINGSPAQFH